MQRKTRFVTFLTVMLIALPPTAAAAGMTPGQYEYTIKMTMTMAGAPGPMTQSITARRIDECKK